MKEKFFEFKSYGNNKAVIYIYGDITSYKWDEDDVTASDVVKKLAMYSDVEEIEVRINSIGGNVFQSVTIMNLLKDSKAKIHVVIDGIAASGASIIAMAGDTITMNDGAIMMIHEAAVGIHGQRDDFEKMIETLDKINSSMIEVYKTKTGLEDDVLKSMLKEETYLTASEALELGFCDAISELEVVAQLKEDSIDINGIMFEKDNIKNALDKMKTKKVKVVAQKSNKEGEGEKMTPEELKAKFPEVYNSIVQEERDRIKSIEDGTLKGCEELSYKAKFEEPINKADYFEAVIKNQKAKGEAFLAQLDDEGEEENVPIKGNCGKYDEASKAKEDKLIFSMAKELGGAL